MQAPAPLTGPRRSGAGRILVGGGLLLAAGLLACGLSRPRAIALGEEPCARCHMTISDPRFTAELLTGTGQAVVFDDVGCLASWIRENSAPFRGAWVTSFTDRTTWLRADSAVYLRTESLRTPMGSDLLALRPGAEADSVQEALGGTVLTWPDVLAAPSPEGPESPG